MIFGFSGAPQEPTAVQTKACAFGYMVTPTVTEVADWTSSRAAGRTKAVTERDALFCPLARICVATIKKIRNAFTRGLPEDPNSIHCGARSSEIKFG
jgi:hypothetical protein